MPEWKVADARAFAEARLEFVEDASAGAQERVGAVYREYSAWREACRPWSQTMHQGDLTRALKRVFGLQEKQKRFQGDFAGIPQLVFLDVRLKPCAEG